MAIITVLVADPQPLFADALGRALQHCPNLQVLEQRPGNAAELICTVEMHLPQVVVASYWLPDLEGPAVVRAILARSPATKAIQLSWLFAPPPVRDSLNAGAVGFMPKTITVDTLIEGILRAQAGEGLIFAEEIKRLLESGSARDSDLDLPSRLAALTPREVEILRLLSIGLTVQDITRHLEIAPSTARTHVHKVLSKLHARSQLEAVTIARDHGLVM